MGWERISTSGVHDITVLFEHNANVGFCLTSEHLARCAWSTETRWKTKLYSSAQSRSPPGTQHATNSLSSPTASLWSISTGLESSPYTFGIRERVHCTRTDSTFCAVHMYNDVIGTFMRNTICNKWIACVLIWPPHTPTNKHPKCKVSPHAQTLFHQGD